MTTAEIDEFSFTVLFPHLWPCRSAAMTGALPHLLSGLLPQLICKQHQSLTVDFRVIPLVHHLEILRARTERRPARQPLTLSRLAVEASTSGTLWRRSTRPLPS